MDKEKLKVIIVLAIVGIMMLLLLYSANFDNISWIEYRASYGCELDLEAIQDHLNNSGISLTIYTRTDRLYINRTWTVLEGDFGESFDNSNFNDTHCVIYKNQQELQVSVRLYGTEEVRVKDLERHKPAIEDSMDFIVEAIYNVTGKYPIQMEYYSTDGGEMEYP